MKKNWYAVYIRPLWEKRVAAMLAKKKIESYIPVRSTIRQGTEQKKLIYDPLFTSFVFVQIEDVELIKVKEIDGVINFIYWLSNPAVIAKQEIDTIKLFLKEYGNVRLEKTSVDTSGNVQIINEPVMNGQGNSITLKNKIKATLPSLGYILTAEGQKSNVEILNTPSVHQKVSFN